jgi:hypothetical protein
MTQLLDHLPAGGLDEVPLLTAGAVLERAVSAQPDGSDPAIPDAGLPAPDPPDAAPSPPATEAAPAPAADTEASAPSQQDPTQATHRRGAAGLMKAVAATGGMLVALAVIVAAAIFLTFPQAARLSHLSQRDISWLIPAAALAAAGAAVAALRAARRLITHSAADLLTVVAAIVATVTSATGMWTFFAVYVPTLPSGPRSLVFAFLEIFTFAEGLRARDNMRDFQSSGVDGIAMWVGAGTSALLASTASSSIAEALFRLVPPLAAAWMWERTLVTERRRRQEHRKRQINWRISPERVLVRLGLAEPSGRTVGDVAAQRRITQVAFAAERAAILDADGAGLRRCRRADRRLRGTLRMAVEHADLATDERRQQQLITQLAILRGYKELATLEPDTPWTHLIQKNGGRKQRQDRRQDQRKDRRQQTEDDRVPENDRQDGDDRTAGDGAFSELAEELTRSLRQDNDGGTARIHSLLSGRDDYQDLVRWLGKRGKFGDKRLMALAALYATRDLAHPGAVSTWIAALVPGRPGQIDKAEIRRIRDLIEATWLARNYPVRNAADDSNEMESR